MRHSIIINKVCLRLKHLMACALLLLMTSCGEVFELDFETPDVILPVQMHLSTNNLYMMAGDTCSLYPVWTPDSITGLGVYWESTNPEVAIVENGLITAVGNGTAMIRAISVSELVKDSCYINVFKEWEVIPRFYQYDMVVYAQVSVEGESLNEDMEISAMCGGEVRGKGVVRTVNGITYLELRIYSNNPSGEQIEFYCHHLKRERTMKFPQTLTFDGEAHGTLNNLYQLVIE